uniref:Protein Red n=1 Tax=Steinernema glaseri TaxID=37863 RepID=A0A1I7ZKK8_9BILA
MDDEWNQFVNETGSSSTAGSAAAKSTAHLRNEDFRKLLGSVRQQSHNATPATHSFTHRHHANNDSKKTSSISAKKDRQKRYREKQQERKEKESMKEEYDDSHLTDILKNYRDRAAERRKGEVSDGRGTSDSLLASINGGYHAVPGDPREAADAALRRQQAIEESKYLGGDIEHTHLVKGLDYSLLNKVRSEISKKGDLIGEDDDIEAAVEAQHEEKPKTAVEKPGEHIPESRMVRNLQQFLQKPGWPKRNELFAKGRMAYIVELEDEDVELPTTLVRSVQDCPVDQTPENVNANNMLIQKLTQVLSYLRADNTKKKKKAETNMTEEERTVYAKADIFEDAGEYVPAKTTKSSGCEIKEKPSSYFSGPSSSREREKGRDRDHKERQRDRDRERDKDHDKERSRHHDKDRERPRDRDSEKRQKTSFGIPTSTSDKEKPKRRRPDSDDDDAYAELFPSGISLLEAGYESDEDADFSKMDMGNKKGPVKRWDFETQEEYEKYLNSQEALPKAAFQYGVKTNDGRKTRKHNTEQEKQKFDREYNQLMKHMEKRKTDGVDGESAKRIRY